MPITKLNLGGGDFIVKVAYLQEDRKVVALSDKVVFDDLLLKLLNCK